MSNFAPPSRRELLDTKLRELDRQRDQLRAELADATMQNELAQLKAWEPTARQIDELQRRINLRTARRKREMERFGSYTRPGVWDDDLDAYQESKYEEKCEPASSGGGGYTIRLVRAHDLTWNGYVILPKGHPLSEVHYDDIDDAPEDLTYSDKENGRTVHGFYQSNVQRPRDPFPGYYVHNHFSAEMTGSYGGVSVYVDYAGMRARCIRLVEYFKAQEQRLAE